MSNNHRPALIVSGMHRSMTSVVANAFNLAGVFLGEADDLHSPDESNPRGFWEFSEIVDIHDELLLALGRRWDTALPLPTGWLDSEAARRAKQRLLASVRRLAGASDLWGFKDPRASLLLPLWKRVLAEVGQEPRVVVCIRHPLAVAESLRKRDGIPLAYGLGIWLNYTLSAISPTLDLPRALVMISDFMHHPAETVERAMVDLDLRPEPLPAEARERIEAVLDPRLNHWAGAVEGLEPFPTVGTVWAELSQAEGQLLDAPSLARVSASHSEWSELLGWDLAAMVREHKKLAEYVEQTSTEAERYVADLVNTISRKDRELEAAYRALQEPEVATAVERQEAKSRPREEAAPKEPHR